MTPEQTQFLLTEQAAMLRRMAVLADQDDRRDLADQFRAQAQADDLAARAGR